MAYVKTNWQTGDVITAAKLNNMETGIYDATEAAADAFVADIDDPQDGDVIKYDGTAEKWVNGAASGGGGIVVPVFTTVDGETFTCDKTFAEIVALVENGNCFIAKVVDGSYELYYPLYRVEKEDDTVYEVAFASIDVTSNNVDLLLICYSATGIILTKDVFDGNTN